MADSGPSNLHARRATRAWEPTHVLRGDIEDARRVLAGVGSAVVLTGAGMSTDSGVPDYRGPNAARATPMLFSEFIGDETNRRRYWARNYQGWARMGVAAPNAGHMALAHWERTAHPTRLVGVISQNVDGLHERAGQRRVVALHGRGSVVICLRCGHRSSRAELQERLAALNPGVATNLPLVHAELRPDFDVDLEDWSAFRLAGCLACGGVLKPDVVFFGEPVPAWRVHTAYAWCDAADAIVAAGSSLTVMSGLRFVHHMAKLGKPVVIVNRGATRADELATVRLDAGVGEVLPALLR